MINEISRLNDGNNCESLFYWSTNGLLYVYDRNTIRRRNGSLGIYIGTRAILL